ncbi:MAG: type II secretion system F family protein [Candidatus Eremiobacteraeota bacterium]|nr:type II secretion system F family protein [Candidatus Eremiobacteraeota bacterium]
MRFRYWASADGGQARDGVVEARSLVEARTKLSRQGLTVLVLEPEGRVEPDQPQARQYQAELLSADERMLFHLQLSTLLASGVPIVEGLEVLSRSESPALNAVVEDLCVKICKGQTMAAAMTSCGAFGPVEISLVQVAEETGSLAQMFSRLANRLRELVTRRNNLVSALAYPAVILVVCVGLLGLLVGYMLPQFTSIFATLGNDLPWLTRLVLGLTSGPWLPMAALLVLMAAVSLWYSSRRGGSGRLLLEKFLYEAPLVGPLALKALLARLGSDLALMVYLGVPLDKALGLLGRPSSGYYCMDEALRLTRVELQATGDLAQAFRQSTLFPEAFVQMVVVGLEVGRLGNFLDQYARLANLETELALDNLLGLLEPLILMILGLGVGLVVLSAFLPMYQVLSQF